MSAVKLLSLLRSRLTILTFVKIWKHPYNMAGQPVYGNRGISN